VKVVRVFFFLPLTVGELLSLPLLDVEFRLRFDGEFVTFDPLLPVNWFVTAAFDSWFDEVDEDDDDAIDEDDVLEVIEVAFDRGPRSLLGVNCEHNEDGTQTPFESIRDISAELGNDRSDESSDTFDESSGWEWSFIDGEQEAWLMDLHGRISWLMDNGWSIDCIWWCWFSDFRQSESDLGLLESILDSFGMSSLPKSVDTGERSVCRMKRIRFRLMQLKGDALRTLIRDELRRLTIKGGNGR
jgi:hypothetical protein